VEENPASYRIGVSSFIVWRTLNEQGLHPQHVQRVQALKEEDLPRNIQSVSEIRVLILTSERTHQFMKLFSITFCKIRKSSPRFFAPQFLPNESFCMIN
jgi:hypothetical protein